MKTSALAIPDVFLIEPKVFGDDRGFFFESFNQGRFEAAVGKRVDYLQYSHSRSMKNVFRGLHYQNQQPQSKLVRVLQVEVFDIVVNLRKSSRAFGHWAGEVLTTENKQHLWVPEGFAHGFVVLSDIAEFLYKTMNCYAPAHERCILWNGPPLQINWPKSVQPILSAKDTEGKLFSEAEVFA